MSWRQGQPYSQDLRDRVLEAPGSVNAIARRFGGQRLVRLAGEDTPGKARPALCQPSSSCASGRGREVLP